MRAGRTVELAVPLGLFGDVRVEGEAADDQQVEADALDRFLGGFLDLVGADGAVLGADGDGHAARLAARVGVLAGRVKPDAGVRVEAVELQALVSCGCSARRPS